MLRKALFIFVLGMLFAGYVRAEQQNDTLPGKTLSQRIDEAFVPVVDGLTKVLYWDPFSAAGIYDEQVYDKQGNPVKDDQGKPVKAPLRLIVLWLFAGGLFFTFFLKFIGFRAVRHAFSIMRGKYSGGKKGEVTPFQSVTTALSATVGMGNIAGVAIGIAIGGPGATFWMIVAGLLGMALKFAECSLGIKYRKVNKDGTVSGGPMYYLKYGLQRKKLGKLGAFLSFLFALLVMGGSVGGGNMLQANQAFKQTVVFFPALDGYGAWYGIGLAFLVGLVIVGGIKSIGRVTSKIVPFMALLYIVSALMIIFINIGNTGHALMEIFKGAFAPGALKGGIIGVMIYGIQRGAFSNEAGIGSAAIAHSASDNKEHIAEGIVASIEPFVDTVVICTMTALVLIFTGYADETRGLQGVQLTSAAFGSVFSWFPYLLLVSVTLFAFSTMISWSYYGLKGFDYLFGDWGERYLGSRKITNQIFNLIFLFFVVVGSSSEIMAVMDFSDMMILAMAFPNLLGLYLLAPEIKTDLKDYWQRTFQKSF